VPDVADIFISFGNMAMEILDEQEKEIKRIAATFECPEGYVCRESGFEKLCCAEDAKINGLVYCLEGKVGPPPCRFAMSFGYRYFCQCRLRVYIAINLKR
jgi:hypothetical protein